MRARGRRGAPGGGLGAASGASPPSKGLTGGFAPGARGLGARAGGNWAREVAQAQVAHLPGGAGGGLGVYGGEAGR